MTNFPETELEVTFASYGGIRELFGFVPNLFRTQALLPHVIKAEVGIARAILLNEKVLSKNQKLFILLAAASAYQNTYCATFCYRMLLHSLGVAERQLDEIIASRQADQSLPDTALINFALKLATNAPGLSGKDIIALRDRGFQDDAILETILVTALSRFFYTLSVGLNPAPDCEPRAAPRRNMSPLDERSCISDISGPRRPQVELSPTRFPPFSFFLRRVDFISDIFRAQALRPDMIAAEADLVRAVLAPEDFLSHVQKECIFLVGSAANLNACWVAARREMLRAMGIATEESDQITVDHRQANPSEANAALLEFARKLTLRSSEFHSEDANSLRRHELTEGQILEAIAATALNSFFNVLQTGLGMIPDVEPKRVLGLQNAHLPVNGEGPPGDQLIDLDTALVARVQEGNLNAFEELFARHSRRVYRTLVAITGNVEEAQDAMQDTFLKAFVHIDSFQSRSKFSTWLTSIASNTALQRLRDQKHLEPLDDAGNESGFGALQMRAWNADPEQLYSQAERRMLVESGLMKLPSKYRVVLVMRDIEQRSTEETATALGLGISALKARLFRARRMLRETLSPHFAVSAPTMDL